MRQPHPLRPALAAAAVLALPSLALAGDDHAACSQRSWNLEGAAATPDDAGSADFLEAWRPAIAGIVRCLSEPGNDRACVVVQGRFDDLGFSPQVVLGFGSLSAAQQARARGRAARVLQELAAAGAAPERLREQAPPSEPSFRGVAIALEEGCVPEPAGLGAEDRRVIEEARQLLATHRLESDPRSAPPPAPPPARPLPFFLEGAAHASAGFGDPGTVVAPGLRAALGLRTGRLVARLGIGGAVAARDEQRLAGEAFLGVAYRVLPWLEVGPLAGVRAGAPEPAEPWLERSWFAGAEATECPFALFGATHLCFQQAVLPFGGQARRGEVEDGGIVRVPAETDPRTRLELSVALRNDL